MFSNKFTNQLANSNPICRYCVHKVAIWINFIAVYYVTVLQLQLEGLTEQCYGNQTVDDEMGKECGMYEGEVQNVVAETRMKETAWNV